MTFFPQFRYLALILGLILSMTAAPFSAQAGQLSEDGLRAQVIGKVLKGSVGIITVRVLHRPDGTSIMRSSMRNDEGVWKIVDNSLCVTRKSRASENCSAIEQVGAEQFKVVGRNLVLTVEQQ